MEKELIKLLEEYIELLGKEIEETIIIADQHGYKSPYYERGCVLREKIANLKSQIK